MIVKMLKVYIAARSADRERMLDRLHELGVIHLVPVEPSRAVADETTMNRLRTLNRAIQVLSTVTPQGSAPQMESVEAGQEVLDIQQRAQERQTRLTGLYRQLEQVEKTWGDIELRQFDQLRDAGIDIQFYSVPREAVGEIQAELAQTVGELKTNRSLVAVIQREGEAKLPEGAEEVHLPQADGPAIREEAAEIDRHLKQDAETLKTLANLIPQMNAAVVELEQKAEYGIALRGASLDEHLFAIQGWVPESSSAKLSSELTASGIDAAIETRKPGPDEDPPTLIEPPAWANPVSGLFKILGTVSGYKEFDVSIPFMVALPIFAAMLISDGGYGLVLLLGLTLGYKKASKTLGVEFTKLMIVISAATLGWGFLSGSFFGFTLYTPVIPVDMTEKSRFLLMEISFILGAIHLCLAHLWNASRIFPDLRFLNELGWTLFIAGMLGLVRMFVLNSPFDWNTVWPYLLIAGGTLAILFHTPTWNIFKMVGLGLANFPLSMLSSFSDIISYVRLMAVGLASTVLAASFNNLAMDMDSWFLAIPVMIFGHVLNIGLALIALFAHGVRLNMLEFSNNLGMQWTGYIYKPFCSRRS
jgi:V/A-type H+-transporting ATPase subunit I